MPLSPRSHIINRIVQALTIAAILLGALFAAFDLLTRTKDTPINIVPWIILVVGIACESGRSIIWKTITKADNNEKDRERASVYKFFFYGVRAIIFVLMLAGLWGVVAISLKDGRNGLYIYQALGMVVLVLWGTVFLSYFIWAIYFYNVNYGMTEEEWDKISEEKKKKGLGEHYNQPILDEEPMYNPYKDETFGLPPGTVRGMIAFTLLFGAISILFIRIGIKNEVDANAVIWDQHEFFCNAFLMMIAFYFGTRSLEILQKKGKGETPGASPSPDGSRAASGNAPNPAPFPNPLPGAGIPGANDDPMGAPQGQAPPPPPAQPIPNDAVLEDEPDPMAPKK